MSDRHPLNLLREARAIYSQGDLADMLEVDVRTIRRWEVRDNPPPPYLADAILQRVLPASPEFTEQVPAFTFIELCAGMGSLRLGFNTLAGRCLLTSEMNPFARKTYLANFPAEAAHQFITDSVPSGNCVIPHHDILLARLPCQSLIKSSANLSSAQAPNEHNVYHSQGTVFFQIASILAAHKPKAFLFEASQKLLSRDKGKTFRVILQTLIDELGYHLHYTLINSQCFTPQQRERLVIVGFREANTFSWQALVLPNKRPQLARILHPQDGSEVAEAPYTLGEQGIVNDKYTLTEKLWTYLQSHKEKHPAASRGFDLVNGQSVARSLSARYAKDGADILVCQGNSKLPRRLTPRECARLMGYPDSFVIPVSDTQAYRQLGESAVVPMISEVARLIMPYITAQKAIEKLKSL